MIWQPHSGPQTEALARSEDEILYGGARGGGKTEAGLAWLIEPEYYTNRMYKGLVIRKNFDDLSDWIARARLFYHGMAEISGNPPVIRFKHGGFIRTGHLKDSDAYNKYLGHEYHKILIEELTQIPREEDYLKLLSTNRSSVPELKAAAFCTTNPGGAGHNWVKERWVKKARNQTYIDPQSGKSRIFIPSRVEDNPTLMNNDPSYINFLNSLPDRLKRAWRDGDWDAFEGQFFEDYNENIQCIDPFVIPREWPLYAGLDPGWSSPCSFILGTKDFEGTIYNILTYSVAGQSPEQHAKMIKSILLSCKWTEGRMPEVIASGHDAWAKKDRFGIFSHELTFYDVFASNGLYLTKANTDRHNGWWAVKQIMRQEKWKYFDGMNDQLINEMIAVIGDEKDPEDIQGKGNDPNVPDHNLDADRYFKMAVYTPIKPKELKPPMPASAAHIINRNGKKKSISESIF